MPDESETGELTELDRIYRANRRYLERYRNNAKIMGVIEEVSRYDEQVNEARMARQKHFADRAERAIRRLQREGVADPKIDPEIAALALGAMVARVAELWLVEHWGNYDLDRVAEQVTRLWANAIGLQEATPQTRSDNSQVTTARKFWVGAQPLGAGDPVLDAIAGRCRGYCVEFGVAAQKTPMPAASLRLLPLGARHAGDVDVGGRARAARRPSPAPSACARTGPSRRSGTRSPT